MTDSSTTPLPRWDLSGIYPGLDSPQFEAGLASLTAEIDGLDSFMATEGIHRGSSPAGDGMMAAKVEGYLTRMNQILRVYKTAEAFIYGHVSTDSFDPLAKRRLSELEILGVRLETQEMRFRNTPSTCGRRCSRAAT